MTFFFIFIFGSYFLCLAILLMGFNCLPKFSIAKKPSGTHFSIIVPFRNEAENLPEFLNAISKMKYPKTQFEVLLINDASEDNSEEIIRKFLLTSEITLTVLQNIRKSNSPKKDALSVGINHSKNNWIITTDADCKVPENWLFCYDSFIQEYNPKMICGPVVYDSNGKFIEDFQQLDGLSLQTVTIGSFGIDKPLLANGANLGFQKKAFIEVNGFSGNDHLASGDDIFLMEKIKQKFPTQLKFLKTREALVRTNPQRDLKSIVQQRIRWASKTGKQKNVFSLLLGILVFCINFLLFLLPFFYFLNDKTLKIFCLAFTLKIIFDYIFIRQSAKLTGIRVKLFSYLLSVICYPFLIIVIFTGSLKGNFTWKGRSYHLQK